MRGHQTFIEHPVHGKPHRTAGKDARKGTGQRLGRHHFHKLVHRHSHGTHSAVFPEAGRHAHIRAVDDMNQADQGNHGEETVHDQHQGIPGADRLTVAHPSVGNDDCIGSFRFLRDRADTLHILIRSISF